MHLYYYKDKIGNFGDDLNPWMWPKILGKPIEDVFDGSYVMIGLGTLLNDINLGKVKTPPEKWVVMGSGAGYGHVVITAPLLRRCPRLFVRGPRSAGVLGLPRDKAIIDPGVLISQLSIPLTREGPRHKASVLLHHPHHNLVGLVWTKLCDRLGWNYIDVTRKPEEIIPELVASEVVISESMHGAICADAVGVPWIPFATSPRINLFKWLDWSDSISLDVDMNWITPLTLQRADSKVHVGYIKEVCEQIQGLYDRAPRYLASRQLMKALTDRVMEFVGKLLNAS